jgi:flagellar basal-body rod protein FlgG
MTVAIQGDGFLEVQLPDGSMAYSRGGKLQVNADHLLATSDGLVLKQRIQVGQDVRQVSIASDGVVTGIDDKARAWNLGRIELALFSNTAGLTPMGDNLYRATPAAGEPLVATPGEAGSGRLLQGFEEASNVKLIDEMVQLMVAQRAYEMNVKVIQAADELAGMANNLRK